MTNKKVLKLAALGIALTCLFACAASVLTACDTTPNNDESTKYHTEYYAA